MPGLEAKANVRGFLPGARIDACGVQPAVGVQIGELGDDKPADHLAWREFVKCLTTALTTNPTVLPLAELPAHTDAAKLRDHATPSHTGRIRIADGGCDSSSQSQRLSPTYLGTCPMKTEASRRPA